MEGGLPWSAPTRRPFLMFGARNDTSPERYAEVARRLAPNVDVYVVAERVPSPAAFAPARVVSLTPASAAAPVAAAAGSPASGDPLVLTLGAGWPTVVDAAGAPRAILSIESGITPATLARCTRGLVAMP
jgi:hypothetical protein